MTYTLRILPAADTDIDEAALYIAQDSLENALRLYDAIDTTYRLIRAHPKRWPLYKIDHPRLQGIRRRAVSGFRHYLVFCRVNDQVVEVIRVLHWARDIPAILYNEFTDGSN